MARRAKPRRGVLLLIVLSLLVLFLLIGMSFLVSAGQFNRLAKSAARTGTTGMPGPKLTDSVLYQLLRGTNNPYSAIQGHSLLEDLYGRDYFIGQTLPNAPAAISFGDPTDHQIQAISFALPDPTAIDASLGGALREDKSRSWYQELQDDYYAGCVLTFLNGTAKGMSTRVLQYKTSGPTPYILFQGILTPGTTAGANPVPPTPPAGETLRFIINGRPFNGTGAGYNYKTGDMDNAISIDTDDASASLPVAFLPNYKSYHEIAALTPYSPTLDNPLSYNYGGMDESWDAVDYQNMFLARAEDSRSADQATLELESSSDSSGDTGQALLEHMSRTGGAIPSFHRPFLTSFLQNQLADSVPASTLEQIRRAVVLRPMADAHPAFTGSNPNFDPINGPWDVDNTGDGIPDSIWIDAGLAPVTAKDGRMYKPLVATHIVDMGGRINANAVDSLERSKAMAAYNDFRPRMTGVIPNATVPLSADDRAAFGQGIGPADISMPSVNATQIRSRYLGNERVGGQPAESLLVDGNQPTNTTAPWLEPATPGVRRPDVGDPMANDDIPLDRRTGLTIPGVFNSAIGGPSSLLTGYGSPTDLHARSIPFLDPQGNMIWAGPRAGLYDDQDDPYEINLVQPQQHDSPFDLNDLASLVRRDYPYESTRARLALTGLTGTNLDNSIERLTTRSFSVPALSTVNPGRTRGFPTGDGLRRSLRELFAARIQQARGTNRATAFEQAGLLMAPEFSRGEKLDINRVLIPNTPPVDARSARDQRRILEQKETFARNLFNLMMLISEPDSEIATRNASLNPQQRRLLFVRRLAQWSINVVDFGDADSVMTPFRYDTNPFDGNPPPPAATSSAGLTPQQQAQKGLTWDEVWGMEHPELLLTETLAFHDRRAEDTDLEENGAKLDGTPPDTDLDQRTPPQGSAFFELYCARAQPPSGGGIWSQNGSHAPEDLYTVDPTLKAGTNFSQITTLNLATRLPNSAKPVWRLAISEITTEAEQTALRTLEDNLDLSTFEPEDLDLDLRRFVWFCDTSPTDPAFPQAPPTANREETRDNTFFNRTFAPEEPGQPLLVPPQRPNGQLNQHDFLVSPGDYVLVGPRDLTPVGLEKDRVLSRQQIKLTDSPNPGQIGNAKALHTRLDGTVVRPPSNRVVPIVAQTARGDGVSISEPTGGYPTPANPGAPSPEGRPTAPSYVDVRPTPLDNEPPTGDTEAERAESAPLYSPPPAEGEEDGGGLGLATGTRFDFRTVFLQRLANPGLPWDPVSNPYRTVDWMPLDLTVFNSLYDGDADPSDPAGDGDANPDPAAGNAALRDFASREKSVDTSDPQLQPLTKYNIWSAPSPREVGGRPVSLTQRYVPTEGQPGAANPDVTASNDMVDAVNTNVPHSLGWLNRGFDIVGPPDGLGHFRPSYMNAADSYWEAPNDPEGDTFPSLVWHNRPYTNPYELMLVPACSSARLSTEYSGGRPAARVANTYGPFGHLLTFFSSSSNRSQDTQRVPNFHRIFDFVTVPSRFKGTHEYLNRDKLRNEGAIPGGGLVPNPYWSQSFYYTNGTNPARIPEFREPGKVNLNTASQRVMAVLGFNSTLKSSVANRAHLDFMTSMTGTQPLTSPGQNVVGRIPTGATPALISNPFRSNTGSDLLAQWPGTSGQTSTLESSGSLLRTSNSRVTRSPILGAALLNNSGTAGENVAFKLQNRKDNPYFRFKDIIKLGNSVTSQSNVYAIWITIGYFEIEPNFRSNRAGNDFTAKPFHIDPAHPDGYRYGMEMGSDIGKVTRHRAFYIVDRSIPVAFEPGVNHNVDKAVLVRHHLE